MATTGIAGAAITAVDGSGAIYTVTVNTGTGDGTLGLNLVDDDSIRDALNNPLGGPGPVNGAFVGETYEVFRSVTIEGFKWNDKDADGYYEPNEPALSGWTVFLDENQNGLLDGGEVSTTTGADGYYSFTGLAPGTHYVAEVVPPSWQQTSPIEKRFARHLISLSSTGTAANDNSGSPSMSGDGRFVAFASYASNLVADDTTALSEIGMESGGQRDEALS